MQHIDFQWYRCILNVIERIGTTFNGYPPYLNALRCPIETNMVV